MKREIAYYWSPEYMAPHLMGSPAWICCCFTTFLRGTLGDYPMWIYFSCSWRLIFEGVWCAGTRQSCSECPCHRSICMLNFVNLCFYCCPQSWWDRSRKSCVSYFFIKGEMLTQWISIHMVDHPMAGTWGAFPEIQTEAGCRWLIYGWLGLMWWNTVAVAPWWRQRK